MYDTVGVCQVGIDFEYLDSVLTSRGIFEESIGVNQFLRIKDVNYNPEKKFIVFDCDVFEHLLN